MYQLLQSGWPVSKMPPMMFFACWGWSGRLVPVHMWPLIPVLCELQTAEGPMGPPGEMGKPGVPVGVRPHLILIITTSRFLTLCVGFPSGGSTR